MVSFVVDNRTVPYQCFYTEAAYASYFRNVGEFIGKFCTFSLMYNWLEPPSSLSIALSPDRVRVVQKSDWGIANLSQTLENRYCCLGSVQRNTWGQYFTDALFKLSAPGTAEGDTIVIFSTDMSMLGDKFAADIDDGLERFGAAVQKLNNQRPNVKVIVLCTIVSENTDTDHYYASPNLIKVQRKLQALAATVSFVGVKNTPLHFEEELRRLVASFAHPLHTKLDLPSRGGANCSLVLELHAATGAARSAMHDGLCAPTLCALVPRTGVDAVLLDGRGLFVRCPAADAAADMLPTENSRRCNALTFLCLARWLAAHDLIAVLRVAVDLAPSLCHNQYWALIPPSQTAVTTAEATQMQLLRLADRDDLLLPSTRRRSANSAGGGDLDVSVESGDSVRLSPEDPDERALVEDVDLFLQASLVECLGAPKAFDPALHPTSSLRAWFEQQRRQPLVQPQRAKAANVSSPLATTVPATPAASVPMPTCAPAQHPSPSTAPVHVVTPARGALELTSKNIGGASASASGGADRIIEHTVHRRGAASTSSTKVHTTAPVAPPQPPPARSAAPPPPPPRPSASKKKCDHEENVAAPGSSAASSVPAAPVEHRAPPAKRGRPPKRPSVQYFVDNLDASRSSTVPASLSPPSSPSPPRATALPRASAPQPSQQQQQETPPVDATVPRFFKRRFAGTGMSAGAGASSGTPIATPAWDGNK